MESWMLRNTRLWKALTPTPANYAAAWTARCSKRSEYAVGLTAPPFHPWCRGCTCPHFADMDGIGERYARDAVTGERFKVPKDMTYEQWRAKQNEFYGTGTVEKLRAMGYNESADQAQFENYKKRLGADAPRSFKDFQNLKYNNKVKYDELAGLYSYKGRVPEAIQNRLCEL